MKIKLLTLFVGFFMVFSVAKADTFVIPHILEVSSGLTPSNALYVFDNIGEWLSLKLTFNPVKKAEKKIKYATERLAELRELQNTDRLEEKAAEKIKNNFEKLRQEAGDDAEKLQNEGRDVSELVEKLEAISERHTAVLTEVLKKAPEEARDAIEHALEVSRRGHERAIEAILKEVEEGELEIEELESEAKTRVKKAREKASLIEELDIDDDLEDIGDIDEEHNENGLNDMNDDFNSLDKDLK